MPDDVFDDDDGVINQDADGKNQSEQRYAVQGVTVGVENEECERQRDGNGQQHHAGFAPAQCQRDQEGDRNRCQEKMFQEFVGFVLGGLAVISCDSDLEIVREDIAA